LVSGAVNDDYSERSLLFTSSFYFILPAAVPAKTDRCMDK